MIDVYNVETEECLSYSDSIGSKMALVCAYEASKNNSNTFTYKEKLKTSKIKECKYGFVLGDFWTRKAKCNH